MSFWPTQRARSKKKKGEHDDVHQLSQPRNQLRKVGESLRLFCPEIVVFLRVGTLNVEKLLLYEPLLQWYMKHGTDITAVYRKIDYEPAKIFVWFVEQLTEARRMDDPNKSKDLMAEGVRLLGNSA